MMTIERATIEDLGDVLAVLNSAADQLHARGLDQWLTGFGDKRIRPYVARAEMWLVRDDRGQAVATVRADPDADPDFWTPAEAGELSLYVSKLARTPSAPGGAGAMLLRWVTDHAAELGYTWVRLDAWRTNTALKRYYLDRGWTYLRTVEAPRRRSGALFQRPGLPDPEARAAFAPATYGGWLPLGTRIDADHRGYRGPGTITGIYAPSTMEVVPQRGEHSTLQSAGYWVQLGGQDDSVICLPEEVTLSRRPEPADA